MLPLCKAFGTALNLLWKKGETEFAAHILEPPNAVFLVKYSHLTDLLTAVSTQV
jgi:hypothetical protein